MSAAAVSAATVELLGPGRIAVRGPLRFATVPALWRSARGLATDAPRLLIELGGVTEADSAALALLVEWTRQARQRGAEVHFTGMPRQLEALARVSGLHWLLP